MLKNLTVYTAVANFEFPSVGALEDALSQNRYVPCTGSQEKSTGWMPPRPNGALLAEPSQEHVLLCFAIETKSVPGQMVKRRLAEEVARIEQEQGRTPGRKEMRELKEDVVRMLLPQAFPKLATVRVWLDRGRRRVLIDSTSKGRLDEVITALVRCIDGLQLAPLSTKKSPQGVMAVWLSEPQEMPDEFGFGRKVELQSSDESRSAVKFDRHVLEDEQVRVQLKQGKFPVNLELEWQDRVGFQFNQAGQIKAIRLLDGIDAPDDEDDPFDADLAIYTTEVSQLLDDLITACGGEQPA